MHRISFIVPAFNEEDRLSGCLQSIRAQKGDVELIVVDNNSSDRTRQIANSLADDVVHCPIQGIAAARNCGATEANGDLLAFIDADGILCRDWLFHATSALHDGRCQAVSGLNYFRENNRCLFCYYNVYSLAFLVFSTAMRLAGRSVLAGNNLLLTRESFEKTGGFPPFVAEDLKLSRRFTEQRLRTSFSSEMKISYSARRFRRRGFLPTMRLWLRSALTDLPDSSYAITYADEQNSKDA